MTMMIDDDSSCCGIGTKIDVPEDTRSWIGDGPNILDALANDDYYKSLTSEEERKAYSNDVYKKNIWVSDYPDPRFFTDSQFRLDNPNYKVKRVTLYEREQKWQKSGRIPIKVSSQSEGRILREIMRQDKLRKRLQKKEKEKEIVCGLKKLKLEEQQEKEEEKEKDQSQLEKPENQTSPQEYKTIQLLAVSVEADENFEG